MDAPEKQYNNPLRVTFSGFCDSVGDTSSVDNNRLYYKYPFAYQRYLEPRDLSCKQKCEDIANCITMAIKNVFRYSCAIRVIVSPSDVAVYTYRDAYPYLRVIDSVGPTYTNTNGEKRNVLLPVDKRFGIKYLNTYLTSQLRRIYAHCVEKELLYTLDLFNYDATSRKHS